MTPRTTGAIGTLFTGLLLVFLAGPGLRAQEEPASDAEPTYADKPLSWWIGQLGSSETRSVATEAIRWMGEAALPRLGHALAHDEDARVREAIAAVLRRWRGSLDPVRDDVVKALDASHERVLSGVLDVLGRLKPPPDDALPRLLQLLAEGPASVRPKAATALGAYGSGGACAEPALIASLEGQDDRALALCAAAALARVAPASERALVALAKAYEPPAHRDVRGAAIRAVADMDPSLRGRTELARRALADIDGKVRQEAIRILASARPPSDDTLADVLRALEDGDASVRLAAVRALHVYGEAAAPAVPALIRLLEEGDQGARLTAAVTLGYLGEAARPALPALVRALPHSGGRPDIAGALRRLMPQSVPALVEGAVAHPEPQGRTLALSIVLDAPPADVEPYRATLLRALAERLPDPAVPAGIRADLLDRLSRMTHEHPEAQAVFLGLHVTPDEPFRARIASAAGRNPSLRPALLEMLSGADGSERSFACVALAAARAEAADVSEIVPLLDHSDRVVRWTAASLLLSTSWRHVASPVPEAQKKTLARVLAEMLTLGEPAERGRAADALAGLGASAASAVRLLATRLPEEEVDLADRMARALAVLAPLSPQGDVANDLRRALAADDPDVVAGAVLTLAHLGQADAQVLQTLRVLLAHPETGVRQKALRAIGVLGPNAALDRAPSGP